MKEGIQRRQDELYQQAYKDALTSLHVPSADIGEGVLLAPTEVKSCDHKKVRISRKEARILKRYRMRRRMVKATEVVWLAVGGISVDPSRLQYKQDDGNNDGVSEDRAHENDNQEFDPLVVPPIAVWKDGKGQVYVVDGHKRLHTAKKRGVPNIRAFYITARSFEEAKKKGEQLNEKMGTKAFDESKHPRAEDGRFGNTAGTHSPQENQHKVSNDTLRHLEDTFREHGIDLTTEEGLQQFEEATADWYKPGYQATIIAALRDKHAPKRETVATPKRSKAKVDPPTSKPKLPKDIKFGNERDANPTHTEQAVKALFKESSPELLAAAANAWEGADVKVDGGRSPDGAHYLFIMTQGDGYKAYRSIATDPDTGKLVASNNSFRIYKEKKGDEWVQTNPNINGTELLTNQVRALRELGVDHITTYAAREDHENPNKAYNGYYTWPRLGYDGEIPSHLWHDIPDDLKLSTLNADVDTNYRRSILGLFTTEEGREWWKEHGDSIDLTFDLKDGSASMRALENYINEKGK
mgnify:FL=1